MSKKKILIIKPIHEAGIELLKSNSNYNFEVVENDDTEFLKTKIKDIYTSGEGGSTYISKKLAEEVPPINIDDSTIRRFITAEEEAGNIVRPTKFKTQEANPDLPKDSAFN